MARFEPSPQALEAALRPRANRLDRHALASGDLARRKLLEEAQHDRRPVGLVERGDRVHDAPEHLDSPQRLGRAGDQELLRGVRVASPPPRSRALLVRHQPSQGSRQPGPQRPAARRRLAQRAEIGLLEDVVRETAVEQESPSESPEARRVLQQIVRVEGRLGFHRGQEGMVVRVESGPSKSVLFLLSPAGTGARPRPRAEDPTDPPGTPSARGRAAPRTRAPPDRHRPTRSVRRTTA